MLNKLHAYNDESTAVDYSHYILQVVLGSHSFRFHAFYFGICAFVNGDVGVGEGFIHV